MNLISFKLMNYIYSEIRNVAFVYTFQSQVVDVS